MLQSYKMSSSFWLKSSLMRILTQLIVTQFWERKIGLGLIFLQKQRLFGRLSWGRSHPSEVTIRDRRGGGPQVWKLHSVWRAERWGTESHPFWALAPAKMEVIIETSCGLFCLWKIVQKFSFSSQPEVLLRAKGNNCKQSCQALISHSVSYYFLFFIFLSRCQLCLIKKSNAFLWLPVQR